MWLLPKKILPFHETCLLALAIAKRLCIQEGSSKVNDLHLLKGIIHCGDARVVAVFDKLELDYNDEIRTAWDVPEEEVAQSLSITFSFTNEVKKILARGSRCAQKKKRKEILVLDLLIGTVEESPEYVSAALKERGINLPQVGKMIAEAEIMDVNLPLAPQPRTKSPQ